VQLLPENLHPSWEARDKTLATLFRFGTAVQPLVFKQGTACSDFRTKLTFHEAAGPAADPAFELDAPPQFLPTISLNPRG